MKRTLSMIALAALTIGLLGSCSKINERLDNLDKRIDGIESEQIASINSQIAGITSSISDLETIRTNIRTLFDEGKVQGESIAALQAADKALEEKIADLRNYMDTELKKYAESEWVSATFATLEQYEEVCRTIEEIEKGVGDLDERLSKSLKETKDTFTAAIKDLSDRVGVLESKVQTIDGQIESIESSISDLETIRESIKALTATTEAQGEDIGELKEADEAIGERIEDLKAFVNDTLKTYPTSEWVKATYATLAQYKETCDSIAKVEAKFGATSEKLSNDIKACTDSLTRWINEEFKGYYTAAQMDAKEKEIRAAIDTARGVSEKTSDSIRTELSKVRVDIDTAKAAITREYTAAIAAAITESEGRLTADIQKAIGDVNDRITTISGTVDNLVTIVLSLLGTVNDLKAMVQSVTIVPAYSDGSVGDVEGGILTIDCIISPATSAASLKKENFTVLVNTVKTKSTTFEKAEISDIRIGENGIVSIFALAPETPADGSAYTVAVNVKSSAITDYTTDFHSFGYSTRNVKVVDLKENDTEYNKVYIVPSNSTDPKTVGGAIPAVIEDGKKTFDGNKPTVIEVRGIGTVTFDKTATAKIAENANGADKVYFTVKDVTSDAQKQAKEIVYQVTMTKVSEHGEEVFSESKAAGEVTMEIPLGSDVADVTKVTLLNENGNPIEGGVVYGSIVYDREKHIITFKVNHFSKYAVGYVLQSDYKPVTSVSIANTLELDNGAVKILTATITPNDATNKNVFWSSSDTTKVKVDKNGKVKAVALGTATITVTTMNLGKTATCEVTVVTPKPYVEIAAKYNGSTTTTLKWYKQNLAITDSGKKAWKGGNGSPVKVPGTGEDVVVGDYFQWGTFAGFYGSGADSDKDKGLLPYTSFTSTGCGDGSDAFTFKDGKQFNQANAPYWSGSAYTKYNTTDNKKTLDASDDAANIILGGTWRMPTSAEIIAMKAATYWKWDATDKGYYVYTPNPASDAGKENNGTGTYNKANALLFFPTAGNGYKDTYWDVESIADYWASSLNSTSEEKACHLFFNSSGGFNADSRDSERFRGFSVRPVQDPAATYVDVTNVSLDVTSKNITVGGNLQLKATVIPDDATQQGVYWTSDKPAVATVDPYGKVTAVAAGTATITVTTVDGGKTSSCEVNVTDTKTMAELLATNTGIPEVSNDTAPSNAWVNTTDSKCKAFIGNDGEERLFYVKKVGQEIIPHFELCMNDSFERIDENTYKHYEKGIVTALVKMEGGKFTSYEITIDSSLEEGKLTCLNGTYAAPKPVEPEYVEIGGVKWATKNLGAKKVTDYGDYFAWGETAPYYVGTGGWPATLTWKSGKSSGYKWDSYCGQSSFVEWSTPPYDATTKILKPEFDAAAQTLGDGWRMPTTEEFKALYDACLNGSYDKTTNPSGASASVGKGVYWCTSYDGVAGCLFCDGTNKLFFPAAGYGNGTSLNRAGSSGYYWSSSLYTDNTDSAYDLGFNSDYVGPQYDGNRYYGFSVRPVKAEIETIADVLATVSGGFPEDKSGGKSPVAPSNPWTNGNGSSAFIYSSALILQHDGYTYGQLTTKVTKGENCYTASISYGNLKFNMTNGILTSFEFIPDQSKPNAANYAGTYTASTFPAGDSGNGTEQYKNNSNPDWFSK